METEPQPEQPEMNLQPADLKQFFMSHLNKIYCAKNHLVDNFPAVLKLATFADLKGAIEESIGELRNQITRMREIYQIMKQNYEPAACKMFTGLIDDLFYGIKHENSSAELKDMSIIYYLQNIESLEMASFHALQMAAVKFKNDDINALLKDNFEEAKTERTMLRLIMAKYLTS